MMHAVHALAPEALQRLDRRRWLRCSCALWLCTWQPGCCTVAAVRQATSGPPPPTAKRRHAQSQHAGGTRRSWAKRYPGVEWAHPRQTCGWASAVEDTMHACVRNGWAGWREDGPDKHALRRSMVTDAAEPLAAVTLASAHESSAWGIRCIRLVQRPGKHGFGYRIGR